MSDSAHFSHITPVFQGRHVPEEGTIVGYGAIIHSLELKIPMPDRIALAKGTKDTKPVNGW